MTNFELYKPYKTRGGWKAVVVGSYDGDYEFGFLVCCHVHTNRGEEIIHHRSNGDIKQINCEEYDLISEWIEPQNPIKRTLWVNVYEHRFPYFYQSEENAKN